MPLTRYTKLQNPIGIAHPGVIYCNGMNTTKESAEKNRRELERRIGRAVELHYNTATGPSVTALMGAEVALGGLTGLAAVGVGIASLFEKDEKKRSRMELAAGICGGVSGGCLAGFGIQYELIRQEKNREAKSLADRVIRKLEASPHADVVLVLHSQGADIGNRALKHYLTEYKDRINVVTLGPAITIPEDRAHIVKNVSNKRDKISSAAQFINSLKTSGRHRRVLYEIESECRGLECHNFAGYLDHPFTHDVMNEILQPKRYELNDMVPIESKLLRFG